MTTQMEKLLKQIGREEGMTEYLREVQLSWNSGMMSLEEFEMRMKVVDEINEFWDKAETEELMDRGSYADQEADYFGGPEL